MNRREFLHITIAAAAGLLPPVPALSAGDAAGRLVLRSTLTVGSSPKSVEFSPDMMKAYINNLEDCTVWVMDATTVTLEEVVSYKKTPTVVKHKGKTINSYEEKPVETCFTHGGGRVWRSLHNARGVTVEDSSGVDLFLPGESGRREVRVEVVATGERRRTTIPFIETGKTPKVLRATPDGRRVCVANWHGATVSVIDSETGELQGDISVGWLPRGIAFTEDSMTGFVADFGSESISVFDVYNAEKTGRMAKVGKNPRHILMGPGGVMYVSFHGDGRIRRFDAASMRQTGEVLVGGQVRTITATADFDYIFADVYSRNEVALVDTAAMRVVERAPSSYHPVGAAFNDLTGQLWVVSQGNARLRVFDFNN